MTPKRNPDHRSGSMSPPRKRLDDDSTEVENGEVFLVFSKTGRVSGLFWDKEQMEQFRNVTDCHASTVAFSHAEGGEQYVKQANKEALHLQCESSESVPKQDARTESANSSRDDVHLKDTTDIDADVGVPESVFSETGDEMIDPDIPVPEDIEAPTTQVTEPSDFVQVFASSTIAKGETPKMAYGVYFGEDSAHNFSGTVGGNISTQRAELMAALAAIGVTIHDNIVTADGRIELVTTSMYVKNGIEKWMEKWKMTNWMNANGKALKNSDLWEELDYLVQEFGRVRVTVRWTEVRESVEIFQAGRLAERAIHESIRLDRAS